MKPSRKRLVAVVFDLDDTLYSEADYVRSGYRAVGRHLNDRLGRDEPFAEWLWARFEAGEAGGAFDALSERFALDLTGPQIDELVRVYREHTPDIRAYDGVRQVLEDLRGRCKLGLLSDGFLPAQQLKLAALDIERFFDAVVFTEAMGRDAWKPSPAGYRRIRDLLGAEDGGCAYVADNPAKDFAAPNKLGWLTVQWIHPGQVHASAPPCEGGAPQRVVRSARQLRAALMP